jgi:BatD DUF11 like domain
MIKPHLKWFFAFIVFVVSFAAISADEVNVTATVDRNQMRPGDTFTYSISVTSTGSISSDQPKLPDMSAFDLINSWSGSEMRGSFANGQVQTQRTQTYNYQFVANREGKYTLGAAEVVAGGQTIRTNPIQLTVTPGAPQAPSQAQQGGGNPAPGDDDEDDVFTQMLQRRLRQFARPTPGLPNAASGDIFFVRVDTDKKKVYAGEQIVVSFYLVTRGQIVDIDTLKYPDLKGFWKEDIEIATRLNFQPEVINGIAYQRALLASYALFPISPGKAEIDSYRAKCRVVVANSMGMPSNQDMVKESETIPIEVLPLPEAGKPAAFSGGVGEFSAVAQVDSPHVKAGQPVTLKVRIDGRGNAKVIDFPKLDLGANIQVYDPKINMKFFPNGKSYKEFETLIVARAPGELKIPSISFSYFNPELKTYAEAKTSEITVQVDPGDGNNTIAPQKLEAPTITKTNDEPRSLPDLVLAPSETSTVSMAKQLGLWSALFLFTILALIGYAYRIFGAGQKRQNLRERLDARLRDIEGSMSRGEWRKVGVQASELITSVLGDIAGLGGASFEFSKLVEKAPPSFKRELAPPLDALMQRLAVVAYAPEAVVGGLKEKSNLQKLLDETRQLLIKAAEYDFNTPSEGS